MKGTKMKNYIFLSILFLVLGNQLFAQQVKALTEKNLDTTVRYGKLKNGFTYYIKKNEVPPGQIQMLLAVKAGYYQQKQNQKEYAHLLEHIGAVHTVKYPQLLKVADSASLILAARTGYDFTEYQLTFSSDRPEKLNLALEFLYEWSGNMIIRENDVAVESGSVIGEGRSKSYYRDWYLDTISNIVLSNTNFGLQDKAGSEASMRNVNIEALKEFHNKWYRPDLEAAIIVGDINPDSLEKVIINRFNDLKSGYDSESPERYNEQFKIILPGKNQYQSLKDSINESSRIVITSKRKNDEKFVRSREDLRKMLLQKLTSMMYDKIGKKLKDQYDPPFENYTSSFSSNSLANGQLQINYWMVDTDNDLDIKSNMMQLFTADELVKGTIDKEMLEKSKQVLYDDLVTKNSESRDISISLLNHFVLGNRAVIGERYERELRQVLEDIGISEIKNYINTGWQLSENTDYTFINIPVSSIPKHQNVMKWYQEAKVKARKKSKLIFREIDTISNVFQPLKNVDLSMVKENEIGVSSLILPNGIKLIFKPSEPWMERYKNQVSIYGYKEVPISIRNKKEYITATTAPDLMFYGDVEDYSKFELKQFMLDHQMRLNYYHIQNQFIIDGVFQKNDIQSFFNVLHRYLLNPKYNQQAFENWKEDQILKFSQTLDHNLMIRETVERTLFTKVPQISKKDIAALTFQDYYEGYNKFTNLYGYTFIITGDFNSEELIPEVQNYLSEFPTVIENNMFQNQFTYNFKTISETVEYEDVNNAVVELYFPVQIDYSSKTQVVLDLLWKRLDEAIFDRLRSGSYMPHAYGKWMDFEKGIYAFIISFDSDLGNQDKMIKSAVEEFKQLRDKGVAPTWLETAIPLRIDRYEPRLDRFYLVNFWPDFLKRYENSERCATEEVLQYSSLLKHFIDLEDVNEAAKKYLSLDKRQEIIIIPKNK